MAVHLSTMTAYKSLENLATQIAQKSRVQANHYSMSATQTMSYTTLELATAEGPQYRQVATTPPRKPTAEEIPIIDLSNLDGDFKSRAAIAAKVKAAAENTGFFYVKNHGISESTIRGALGRVKDFFDQPSEEKEEVLFSKCGRAGGYHGLGSTQINRTETAGM